MAEAHAEVAALLRRVGLSGIVNDTLGAMSDIRREVEEFQAFRSEHPFPTEAGLHKWLTREINEGTASANMLGEPWLRSYGFDGSDVVRLDYFHMKKLYEIGLQPHDAALQSEVRDIGHQLYQTGGFRMMQFHFVILQGMVNSSAFFNDATERKPGVFAFSQFVSKCWSGVGSWLD